MKKLDRQMKEEIRKDLERIFFVIGQDVEENFSQVKEEKTFKDIDYNLMVMNYFSYGFDIRKGFFYEMFPF